MADYAYSEQIRSFVVQFIRMFSEFQIEYGKDNNGNPIYLTLPVRYADTNKATSSIINNNSENMAITAPMMVCYIDGLKYDRDRLQDPTYVEKRTIRELARDKQTGERKTYQGNVITVERLMPAPWTLSMKLDIYTTNTEQKLQIFEQLAGMFNPVYEIQSNETFLDWTSLSYVELVDFNYTNKPIPIANDDPDIMTYSFKLPIFITSPAKVKRLNAVTGICATIFDAHGNPAQSIIDQYEQIGKRQWFTPSGYDAIVSNGQVLLSKLASKVDNLSIPTPVNAPIPWRGVINYIGEITNGVSQMGFVDEITGNIVFGAISYHPTDENILLFEVDELSTPSNTLDPLNNVIDPLRVAPGKGLPSANAGQRYLIVENQIGNINNDPDNNPIAWRNSDNTPVLANINDIIEYNGTHWVVVFDASEQTENSLEYLTNSHTGVQFKWARGMWQKSWQGKYTEGNWIILL